MIKINNVVSVIKWRGDKHYDNKQVRKKLLIIKKEISSPAKTTNEISLKKSGTVRTF
jgi:hypothetical protein